MQHVDLLVTLTAGLATALVLGYVTHRVGLSPIVGYLLAGFVVGPNTPGFAANREIAEELAHIGVILLMFGVGLHFHVEELFRVRRVAIPGAIVQSLATTILSCFVAWGFGWGWAAGLVFGLAISVASTVVLLRVLADNNALHTTTGHIAVGWLIVEDLFTVLVLVLLPALFGQNAGGFWTTVFAISWSVIKLCLLFAFTFFVGGRVIPWILAKVAETRSRELFTLTILVIALGIAVGSAKLFGASMELGAFLAGLVVGRSDFSSRAASEALPMRDAFAVLFFVSIGMLFNPISLMNEPGVIVTTLIIIMVGKPLAALAIVLVLGYPLRVALSVAIALAQIGEFSFILGSLGRQLGILPGGAMDAMVFAAIVSISLNPILYRSIDALDARIRRYPRVARWLKTRAESASSFFSPHREQQPLPHAIIVGFGPIGQTVARLLQESEIDPVVIELNLETVQQLKNKQMHAVYGDAAQREILQAARIESAIAMLLTSSEIRGGAELIRLAREMNPEIHVIARTNYAREAPALRQAGADAIFSGEGEVALTLIEFVLRELGATPEQIDRETARMREELVAVPPPRTPLLQPQPQAQDPAS